MARIGLVAVVTVVWATAATAERASLFPGGGGGGLFAAPGAPLVVAAAEAPLRGADRDTSGGEAAPTTGGSLFAGGGGLFAPIFRTAPGEDPIGGFPPGSPVARLLHLIAKAEAGGDGFDAVQHGARIRPGKAPTQMTLGEIYDWIDATPGQPHAIGRYQFIPPTLRRLARDGGLGREVRFTPMVQDRLAYRLLREAGIDRFEAGEISRGAFMRNLAKIWAGLPLPNGQSYYEGYAGNRATKSWNAFATGMADIWPDRPG